MNRYILLRRVRGPIFLLTFGLTALLAEFHVLGFDRSWPLYIIVAGVLALAERSLLATLPPPSGGFGFHPGYGGYPAPSYPAAAPPPAPGSAVVTTSTSLSTANDEGKL